VWSDQSQSVDNDILAVENRIREREVKLKLLAKQTGRRTLTALTSPASLVVVAALGFLAVAIHEHWTLVALSRFVFGCGVGLGVAHAEYTAIARVRSDLRPVMVGLFGLAVGAGHMLGTLLTEYLGVWPIRLAVCGLIASSVVLIGYKRTLTPIPALSSPQGVWQMMRLMPAAFAAPVLFGFLDNGLLAMLPSYAMQLGLPASQVTALSFWAFAGILVFQLPVGMLCAKYETAMILRAGAIAAIAAIIILSMAISLPGLRLVLAFVLGGIVDVFYTVGLVAIASRLPKQQLVIGNACFVSLCGVGEVAGPVFSGQIMTSFGSSAFFGVVALLLALYWFGAALWRGSEASAERNELPFGHDRRTAEPERAIAAA